MSQFYQTDTMNRMADTVTAARRNSSLVQPVDLLSGVLLHNQHQQQQIAGGPASIKDAKQSQTQDVRSKHQLLSLKVASLTNEFSYE